MTTQDCPDILKKIVITKQKEISNINKTISDFKSTIANIPKPLDFKSALNKKELAVIAEIKQASPSAGVIAKNFQPKEMAQAYKNGGADAVSILTDKEYFKGDIEYIKELRDIIKVPIIRKDFIIDPIQIYEARAFRADSFLLIAAILTENQLHDLISLGRELEMEPLVEAHNEEELTKTINAGATIIGINNRNLHDFTVDITLSERLLPTIPKGAISVSESGIHTPSQAHLLNKIGFSAILVGETLMKSGINSCGKMIKNFKHS